MPIGELARRVGRSASSIRYYEQIGLLPTPARRYGQRRYDVNAIRQLTVIDAAQRAGLTLDEIKTLLDAARSDDSAAVEQLRLVAERKLPELTAMIERSMMVRKWLRAAARCECPSLYDCALFDDTDDFDDFDDTDDTDDTGSVESSSHPDPINHAAKIATDSSSSARA